MEKEASSDASFPKQPDWFEDARGFKNLEQGLKKNWFSRNRGK